MAISYIDFNKVEEVSSKTRSLVEEYQSEINKLFSKIQDVRMDSSIWVGKSSSLYFSSILKEKKEYLNLAMKLNNICNILDNNAFLIKNRIITNETKYESIGIK